MKWFYVTALVVIGLLVALPYYLLGHGGGTTDGGGVVGYNVYGSKVKSVDPATCGDTTSAGIQGGIYEGLYCYHYLARPIKVIPHLAEGMPKVSDDVLPYTIKIKKLTGNHYNNTTLRSQVFGAKKYNIIKLKTN